MNRSVYFIGGSPCSGKSTAAESLAKARGLRYFKVDERLDAYIRRGATLSLPVCSRIAGLSPDETWLRDPKLQNREELAYYREVFPFVLIELDALSRGAPVIAEGVAYLPELMSALGVPDDRYLSVTPTRAFQIDRYQKRPWVSGVLEGCSDKEQAFCNWMDRDALFAKEVRRQCAIYGYASLVTDFDSTPEKTLAWITAHFGL